MTLLDDYGTHSERARETHSPESHDLMQRQRQPAQFDPSLAPHPRVPYPVSNPSWWEQSYRQVPEYRPVHRELDPEQRRQNALFMAVGRVMIAGCCLIANWSSVWRNTMGRFTDYGIGKIGGEF